VAVRIYTLRHGESVSNADPRLATLPGADGDRLTDHGRAEAEAAAEGLRRRGLTKLLHSPPRRAAETADRIGRQLGLEPVELDCAHEVREPAGYDQLDAEQQRLQRWSERMYEHRDDPDFSRAGSESFNDVLARVRRLEGELDETTEGEVPLLVTHGIFLRFLLFDSLLVDAFVPGLAKRMWHLRTVNCGLSVFEKGERGHPVDADTPGWVCLTWMQRLAESKE
jgi:broad specificity phosphatase PhoE